MSMNIKMWKHSTGGKKHSESAKMFSDIIHDSSPSGLTHSHIIASTLSHYSFYHQMSCLKPFIWYQMWQFMLLLDIEWNARSTINLNIIWAQRKLTRSTYSKYFILNLLCLPVFCIPSNDLTVSIPKQSFSSYFNIDLHPASSVEKCLHYEYSMYHWITGL
jgi:hypothetical protein